MSILKEIQSLKKKYIKQMRDMVFSIDHPDYDIYFDELSCEDNFVYLESEFKRVERELKKVNKKSAKKSSKKKNK